MTPYYSFGADSWWDDETPSWWDKLFASADPGVAAAKAAVDQARAAGVPLSKLVDPGVAAGVDAAQAVARGAAAEAAAIVKKRAEQLYKGVKDAAGDKAKNQVTKIALAVGGVLLAYRLFFAKKR